jgi:hypothetical protein
MSKPIYPTKNKPIPLFIYDLYNEKIEVTDLQKAITQADQYRKYDIDKLQHSKFLKGRKLYWEDMYNKLTSGQKSD